MHGQTWEDVAELPAADPPAAPEAPDPWTVAGSRYVELPESGWGALVGWTAGTTRMLRCPDRLDRYVSVMTTRTEDGHLSAETGSRTCAEQASVDDDIDDYLHDAGVPPRPRRYRWFLRLPDHYPDGDALFSAINAAVYTTAAASNHPADLAGPLTRCLAAIYRQHR